jgi:biopolymer transport protein ExbB
MDRLLDQVAALFGAGGSVLWLIAAGAVLMWLLILERYWFISRELRPLQHRYRAMWSNRRTLDGEARERVKAGLLRRFATEATRSIAVVQVLTSVLPLLGLLGTVSGMIRIFEVMTVFGTGNVRGIAGGISEALITTLAGLVTALSGLYFASHLRHRLTDECTRLAHALEHDDA